MCFLSISYLPPTAAYVEGREEGDRGASQQPMTQVKYYTSIHLLKKGRPHHLSCKSRHMLFLLNIQTCIILTSTPGQFPHQVDVQTRATRTPKLMMFKDNSSFLSGNSQADFLLTFSKNLYNNLPW